MGRAQLSDLKSREKENLRLQSIVAALEFDKLSSWESVSYLKSGPDHRAAPLGRESHTPEARGGREG